MCLFKQKLRFSKNGVSVFLSKKSSYLKYEVCKHKEILINYSDINVVPGF